MAGETSPAVSPLEICPLEIWSKIFDKLDCPSDVASCYRTCRDWMTFLEPKRAHFLMPEVFPLIVKYLTVNNEKEVEDVYGSVDNSDLDEDASANNSDLDEDASVNNSNFDEDASADNHDLDDDASNDDSDWEDVDDDGSFEGSEEDENHIPNPILSSRLVCKAWKYAVDNFLQNHPYHTNTDFPNEEENLDPSKAIDSVPINHYEFDVTVLDKLENLVKTDFPPDCNPILTRYVKYYELVYVGPGNEAIHFPRLRTAFTNLLELHGTQIWHASFALRFPEFAKMHEKRSVYNLIHRYLSLMPNLKTLDLTFNTGCSSSNLRSATPSLEQLLVTNPLPTLEQLTTLHMASVPAPLEKGLLLKNNHVQKLFWLSESLSASSASLLNIQMNNLEEFTTHVKDKLDLRTLRSLSWPFKKLAVGIEHLDSAIRAISASHFANNLKHLIVDVAGDEGFNKLNGKLELPNLITFQIIADYTPLKNIDFLLPTTVSLSSLQIEMKAEQEPTRSMTTCSMGKPTQVIQFDGHVPNMLESNIWNHFSKLKYLKIVKYNPNHVRDLTFSCCGGEPNDNHFKNEMYEYTRGDWQIFVKKQSK